MDTLAPLSSEFKVGTGARADVSAANGGYAFAWVSPQGSRFSGPPEYLKLAEFRPDGSPLLAETNLDSSITRYGGYYSTPGIERLSDGSIVVVWAGKANDGINDGFIASTLAASTLDLNGVVTKTNLLTVPPYSPSIRPNPELSPGANGSYTLAYEQSFGNNNFDVRTASFSSSGATLLGPLTVNDATPVQLEVTPSIARLSDGRQVVGWVNATTIETHVHLLDSTGTPIGSDIVLGYGFGKVALAGLSSGGFVAAWTTNADGTDVIARLYSASGTPLGTSFKVNQFATGEQNHPAVVALSDGTFAISWTDASGTLGDSSGTSIHLRRFSSSGTPLGDELRVNTDVAGDQTDSALAAANGNIAITWTTGTEVHAQVLGVINAIEGTIGNDNLVGTAGPDVLRGFAGDDILSGLAGDDRLEGGPGNDTLLGGDGNDTLDPGTGRDTVDGGAGIDTLSYQSAASAVIVDMYVGQALFGGLIQTLSNLENAIGSPYGDSLFGTRGPNTLEGRDGNDVLVGGDGDDILLGGAGDDRIDPGLGKDYVDGGTGIDTLDLRGAEGRMIVDLNAGQTYDYTQAETVLNVENVIGSRFNDVIYGSETVANVIDGGPGGADTLYGGGDFGDVISYASLGRGVIIDFGVGKSYDGVDLDTFSGFEGAIGSAYNDQIFATNTQTVDPGAGGADTIVNPFLLAYNSQTRPIIIDLSVGLAADGVDLDHLTGVHNVRGSAYDDQIFGSDQADRIDGGGGFDRLLGGAGNDTFVLRRGEADGDVILDFTGNGNLAGDSIELVGYSPGSTFTQLAGNSTAWLITDAATGLVDVVRIIGAVSPSDFAFVLS